MIKLLVVISTLLIAISAVLFVGTTLARQNQVPAIHRSGSCVDILASPDYLSSGSAQDAIAAINNARAYEYLPSLNLPNDFYHLDAVNQQFALVNLERTDRGLPKYQMDTTLSQMALAYSKQLRDLNFFAHSSPIAGTFAQRMNGNPFIEGHYDIAAENLAGNPVAGIGAMYEYMYNDINESCGHRRNILDPTLHLIGIGEVASSQYGSISAQEFLASATWNPYHSTQTTLVAPQISIRVDSFVPKKFLLCEANTQVHTGTARITWFLDHLDTTGQIGPRWSLDLHQLASGKHTVFAYVVDGMQSYAVARYNFQI